MAKPLRTLNRRKRDKPAREKERLIRAYYAWLTKAANDGDVVCVPIEGDYNECWNGNLSPGTEYYAVTGITLDSPPAKWKTA